MKVFQNWKCPCSALAEAREGDDRNRLPLLEYLESILAAYAQIYSQEHNSPADRTLHLLASLSTLLAQRLRGRSFCFKSPHLVPCGDSSLLKSLMFRARVRIFPVQ